MSAEEWAEVRAKWEADPREGYTWIVNEMRLAVSVVAVLKRARNEGWAKKASLKAIVERAQSRADEKVNAKVNGKVNALTNEDSVNLRADVIDTHRAEWSDHRSAFTKERINGEDDLGVAKVAKLAAEVIKIRQEGERKAWGLDAITEDTTGGTSTIEQLDIMFAQAIKRTEEMKDELRRDRGTSAAD